MTVTVASLTYPRGEIQPVWFPDGDLAANLAIWIDEVDLGDVAAGEAQDNATRAWAYHRAYATVAGRLAAMPTTEKTNDLTTTIDHSRIQYFRGEAQKWETVYRGILAETAITPDRPISSAANVTAVW